MVRRIGRMKKLLLIVIFTTCAALDARADGVDIHAATAIAKLEAKIQQLELRIQKLEALYESGLPKRTPAKAKPVGDSRNVANWRRLKKGMSIDQLIAILGEPSSVTIINESELWFYKGGKPVEIGSVHLDKNDRVQSWTSP